MTEPFQPTPAVQGWQQLGCARLKVVGRFNDARSQFNSFSNETIGVYVWPGMSGRRGEVGGTASRRQSFSAFYANVMLLNELTREEEVDDFLAE